MLVKVLAVEGNRIKLSRKAILREQRAKMGGGEAPADASGAVTFEGGHEKADEPSPETNYNRDGERREHAGSRRDGGITADAAVVAAQVAGAAEIVDRVVAHAGRHVRQRKDYAGRARTFSLFLLWQNSGPSQQLCRGVRLPKGKG